GPEAGAGQGKAQVQATKKPKKKYIRNPETHKVYRARMERELAEAKHMLQVAHKAMVDLARDYRRQRAIIDAYKE
ncbi:unnamed protein product, partial [Choristocarpus tenellus]